jgi:hypothetical protein
MRKQSFLVVTINDCLKRFHRFESFLDSHCQIRIEMKHWFHSLTAAVRIALISLRGNISPQTNRESPKRRDLAEKLARSYAAIRRYVNPALHFKIGKAVPIIPW